MKRKLEIFDFSIRGLTIEDLKKETFDYLKRDYDNNDIKGIRYFSKILVVLAEYKTNVNILFEERFCEDLEEAKKDVPIRRIPGCRKGWGQLSKVNLQKLDKNELEDPLPDEEFKIEKHESKKDWGKLHAIHKHKKPKNDEDDI